MRQELLKRVKERKGQTSVEYILIIVVIVGAVFLFGDRLKEGLKTATDTLFGEINSAIGDRIK